MRTESVREMETTSVKERTGRNRLPEGSESKITVTVKDVLQQELGLKPTKERNRRGCCGPLLAQTTATNNLTDGVNYLFFLLPFPVYPT